MNRDADESVNYGHCAYHWAREMEWEPLQIVFNVSFNTFSTPIIISNIVFELVINIVTFISSGTPIQEAATCVNSSEFINKFQARIHFPAWTSALD
jgi:hypothetical protein